MPHSIEVEIERNYSTFLDILETLLPASKGKYALLHNKKLHGVFDTAGQAEAAGFKEFGQSPYSIQQVNAEPVDLGFYSYTISEGAH